MPLTNRVLALETALTDHLLLEDGNHLWIELWVHVLRKIFGVPNPTGRIKSGKRV